MAFREEREYDVELFLGSIHRRSADRATFGYEKAATSREWMGGGGTVAASAALPAHSLTPREPPQPGVFAVQEAWRCETEIQLSPAERHLPSHVLGRLPRHLDSPLRRFPAERVKE
jgi:hypothetical protein